MNKIKEDCSMAGMAHVIEHLKYQKNLTLSCLVRTHDEKIIEQIKESAYAFGLAASLLEKEAEYRSLSEDEFNLGCNIPNVEEELK